MGHWLAHMLEEIAWEMKNKKEIETEIWNRRNG